MKVLITGSKGFIGKNLLVHLKEMKDIEIVEYDKDDDFSKIEREINSLEIIFHLAGVNRSDEKEDFYNVNTNLTKKIINLLNVKKLNIPLVYSSSIQAEFDNDYGKSKKKAEDYIIKSYANSFIFRLHNVFGKWCNPNYNSVVATFCNNIALGKEITITDPDKVMELVYIDDVCYSFLNVLKNKPKPKQKYYYIKPIEKITLKDLSNMIYFFKDSMNSIVVPKTGDEFIKKLYSTYISYVPVEETVVNVKTNVDERGSFTELIRSFDSGQVSISFSKPGVIRGNHYHNTKIERFIVVKGKAKISFENIVNKKDSYNFEVTEKKLQIITIPIGYTHKIENIGDNEMILIIWCNELYDETKPDTYWKDF